MASTTTAQTEETTTDTPTTSTAGPIPVTTIGRSMYHLLDTDTNCFSDVSFRVGPTREEFKAHRIVLAAASEVFNVMFQDRWSTVDRKKKIKNENEIDIPSTTPQAFKQFLKFLYVEELSPSSSICNSFELLSLAHQYDVPKLLDRCSSDLLKQINLENCLQIYEGTRLFPDLALTDKAFEFLTRNFEEIVKSDQFLTVEKEILNDLLRSDELKIDEVDLFKALVRWGQRKINGRESRYRKSAMTPLLQLIRYPLMGAESFAKEVVPTNVLSSEAALEMLAYLNGGISEVDLKLLPAINIPRGNDNLDCSESITLFDHDLRSISPPTSLPRTLFKLNHRQLVLKPQVRFKIDQAVTIYGVEVYGVNAAEGQIQPVGLSALVETEIKNLPYVQSVYVAITSAATPMYSLNLNSYTTTASEGRWFVSGAVMADTNTSFEVLLKEPLQTVPGQWYWISATRDIHLSYCFYGYDKNYCRYIGWTNCDRDDNYTHSVDANSDNVIDVTKIVKSDMGNIKVDLRYDRNKISNSSGRFVCCSEDNPHLSTQGYIGCIRSLILNRRGRRPNI